MKKEPRFHFAILCAAAAAMIFLYGTIDYEHPSLRGTDLAYYRQMAAASPGFSDQTPSPFAYRFLGPYIAGLVPFSDDLGFLVLTYAISIMLPLLLYSFLLEFGIGRRAALFAALLYLFNKYFFGIITWNYFQVKDALSLAFIAAGLIAMLRRNWPLMLLSLLGGSASGEAPIILVPVLFVFLAERRLPRREWLLGGLSTLPGIAAFVLVRVLVPARGGMSLAESFTLYAPKLRFYWVWAGLLVTPYVPLSLVPLVYARDAVRFARKNQYLVAMLALTLVSTLFGLNNERLMAPSFVVFYAFIGRIAEDHWSGPPAMRILIAGACFVSSFHYMIARYPLPSRMAGRVIAGSATLIVAMLAFFHYRSQRGRGLGRNLAP